MAIREYQGIGRRCRLAVSPQRHRTSKHRTLSCRSGWRRDGSTFRGSSALTRRDPGRP